MFNHDESKMSRKKLLMAGMIASKALEYACKLVKANVPLLKIAEAGEAQIRKLGGLPAFPINISINHHAAHYTPHLQDTSRVPDLAMVKVDLGVHVDGFIADNARTVLVGDDENFMRLMTAAEAGLQAAIQTIRAGIRVWQVSKAIAQAMYQNKVRAIENLTGHTIEVFNLHAGISVPAIARSSERFSSPRLKEHMVVAIEPFATNSHRPYVENLEPGHIYGFAKFKNPKSPKLRALFSQMKVKFSHLPFASRWMAELVESDQISSVLEQLLQEQCIYNYPVLGLQDESVIAQAEHTMIVEQTGCTVSTRVQNEKKGN